MCIAFHFSHTHRHILMIHLLITDAQCFFSTANERRNKKNAIVFDYHSKHLTLRSHLSQVYISYFMCCLFNHDICLIWLKFGAHCSNHRRQSQRERERRKRVKGTKKMLSQASFYFQMEQNLWVKKWNLRVKCAWVRVSFSLSLNRK